MSQFERGVDVIYAAAGASGLGVYQAAVDNKKLAIGVECAAQTEEFDVRPRQAFLPSANFSGGNQQKLIVALELSRAPQVLLLGQPTCGVNIANSGCRTGGNSRPIVCADAGEPGQKAGVR